MTRFVVITPVLNAATYVAATLDSVLSQTDSDWVHYIIDGGSTDGTLELVTQAAAEEPRRRIVTGRDKGLYDALFKGFEHASADGINDASTICVWLNADDLLMPWAFVTLRHAFEETGAEWITALPALWDKEGRLVVVQPYNWYPRRLIRAGQFHGRSLGFIQQESTFFTRGLLSRLPDSTVETIRNTKLAGDFLLWREFASHTALVSIVATVAGFRNHGANASVTQFARYFDEVRDAGVRVPPTWLGRILRLIYSPLAMLAVARNYRRRYAQFASGSSGPPPPDCGK
jgi:glycosyltransferase involved in cell wall biosynthesis